MIVVFKETCLAKKPFCSAFPTYEAGIGYEVGTSISQYDADQYVAGGQAVVAGQEAKKSKGSK